MQQTNGVDCENAFVSVRFLNRFKQSSELHKEMLAILAAITEVIKERNGTQSSTEYFLALLETIEATKQENEIVAAVSLLSIGIKRVPAPVLRKKYADCAPLLQNLFEQFVSSDNQNVLRAVSTTNFPPLLPPFAHCIDWYVLFGCRSLVAYQPFFELWSTTIGIHRRH